jgi:hypothetical protein
MRENPFKLNERWRKWIRSKPGELLTVRLRHPATDEVLEVSFATDMSFADIERRVDEARVELSRRARPWVQ